MSFSYTNLDIVNPSITFLMFRELVKSDLMSKIAPLAHGYHGKLIWKSAHITHRG